VLDRHAREDVCGGLRARRRAPARGGRLGARRRGRRRRVAWPGSTRCGSSASPTGRPRGEARETTFLTAARDAGVLFKRGAYDYAALAHDAAVRRRRRARGRRRLRGRARPRRGGGRVTGRDRSPTPPAERRGRRAAEARRDEGARRGTPASRRSPARAARRRARALLPPATPARRLAAVNAARLRAGERMGVTWHVASVLGTGGHVAHLLRLARRRHARQRRDARAAPRCPDRVRAYVHVNPNFPEHARAEIDRGVGRGAVGVKLSASRRADDPLLDPIAAEAGRRGLPILHHVWQWRRRDWPMQEASDGVELARLAAAPPAHAPSSSRTSAAAATTMHTFPAVADLPNVHLDLSGSGVDRGMLDAALAAVGARRLLWACDVTMCTGLAKLRALDHVGLDADGPRRRALAQRGAALPGGRVPHGRGRASR
jgi:hypothetical protein